LEATSGILLFGAAVIAMLWANSPARGTYSALLSLPLGLQLGPIHAQFTVAEFINDGLMSIFFFVVGMEIKRELVLGELRTVSKASLPGIAALGGMAVPAAIYLAFNWGQPGAAGWAIPMATDIAFCIGCLTLLKGRIPNPLIVFVTALAIFDDMGGILVIALFYGHGIHALWIGGAAGVVAVLALFNRMNVRNGVAFAVAGLALWYAVHHSGIHATISGVILGLMIEAREARPTREVVEGLHSHTGKLLKGDPADEITSDELLQIEERLEELEPPLNRFVHLLHPWVAFVIMPVFALANSGIDLSGTSISDLSSPVLLGTALGLVLGKAAGIFIFTAMAVRLGVARRPGGASKMQLFGVSVVAGIGFTVALFIASLAFADSPKLLEQAKLGILMGSLVAGVAGYLLLRLSRPKTLSTV
jgi:Na+:H+ antiporter, NhaA family